MEWYSGEPDRPLYDFLKRGEFHDLIMEIYQNTSSYSLEQLCEMEEKIKERHIRLWREGRIQYSVTRFSNIMPDLLHAGVKTYFVYPKYEILKEAITTLLQEVSLKAMLQNQTTIAALNQQYSSQFLFQRQADPSLQSMEETIWMRSPDVPAFLFLMSVVLLLPLRRLTMNM